ncbi:MAG: STAS domain-containing protein [Fimbriimonadaceae bacterium]|nr:STAS domain-containing protein [Fimbriimonadaceae bacterium]
MKITKEVNNRKVTLKLEGNFTYTQRKPFQEMLKSVAVDGVDQIVIELSQVAFLDSAALGLLMISHRQLQAEKRTLSLAYPQPTVRQIIELANLHKTIPLIDADAPSTIKKSA